MGGMRGEGMRGERVRGEGMRGEGMREHHFANMAQNQQNNNNISGLGDNGFYGGFGFSVDCFPRDPEDIGRDFNCGSPRKARVR
jgi:hypothetical protein